MSDDPDDEHLSHIATQWTLVFQAHQADSEARQAAKSALIQRYSGAIYRYLLKVLGQADAADEVFQEFALQLVRGGFHRANPELGRFRDYVKVSVLRLVSKYRRRRAGDHELADQAAAEAIEDDRLASDFDQSFTRSYREELMGRAWNRLQQFEHESGQTYYTVLRFRAENPDVSSEAAAHELSQRETIGRTISPAGIRKLLQRSRVKFGELLVEESRQCTDGSDEAVEALLIELNLHVWCGDALKQ